MSLDWLSPSEREDIFRYVKNNREEYAERIHQGGFSVYSNPQADLYLDRLDSVMFSPQDVTISSEKNWLIDSFGSKEDFIEFHQKRGKNVKFCIYHGDEVLDRNHPAFYNVEVEVKDFTGNSISPTDNHGTSTASQYGASDGRFSPFPDIAENQMIIKAGTVLYGGSGDFQQIANFIRWATVDSADMQDKGYYTIMNLSLGADASTPPELEKALQAAHKAGILIFAATGNSARSVNSTPAVSRYAQGVMALTPELERARFSNVGTATAFAEGGVMNLVANRQTRGVGHQNGTSFASPFKVNAAIAILSLFPDEFKRATDCLPKLKKVTNDLGTPGKDSIFGWGKAELRKILDYTPKQTTVELPKKDKVKKRTINVKTIKGKEISYKKEDSAVYETIFVEELDFSYTGFLTPQEVETEVGNKIDEILRNTKFITETTSYVEVAKYVFAYVCKQVEGLGITYALIDNNEDADYQVELERGPLAYWPGKRSKLMPPGLFTQGGKRLLKTV